MFIESLPLLSQQLQENLLHNFLKYKLLKFYFKDIVLVFLMTHEYTLTLSVSVKYIEINSTYSSMFLCPMCDLLVSRHNFIECNCK